MPDFPSIHAEDHPPPEPICMAAAHLVSGQMHGGAHPSLFFVVHGDAQEIGMVKLCGRGLAGTM